MLHLSFVMAFTFQLHASSQSISRMPTKCSDIAIHDQYFFLTKTGKINTKSLHMFSLCLKREILIMIIVINQLKLQITLEKQKYT